MKASCSVWSADLLALRNAIDSLTGHADEFHVDVMDGDVVPDILFGLDFVAAMRAATETPLDVHLMTRTTAGWIERSVEAGAARVAVHANLCHDVRTALRRIESLVPCRSWCSRWIPRLKRAPCRGACFDGSF